MTLKGHISLKDVGKLAGVSAATASMALRQDPRITKATQDRVKKAAAALGYVPDPLLSALVARRDRNRGRRVLANLAVLLDARWLEDGSYPLWLERFFEGMRRMAGQLGYAIEIFHYPEDLQGNFEKMLRARGILGIVLFPLPGVRNELKLNWDLYALVVIGHPAFDRVPHRIGSDPFAAMSLVCTRLRKYGYRRIGLAHALSKEAELRYEFLGSICKEAFIPGSHLEVVRPHVPENFEREAFLEWVKQEGPECVITVDERVYHWLKAAGYKVPETIGVAFLNINAIRIAAPAGAAFDNDVTGENAVDLLHALILRGETGFPAHSKEVLAYPVWVDGGTVAKRLPREGSL